MCYIGPYEAGGWFTNMSEYYDVSLQCSNNKMFKAQSMVL
jgi:hypothetical protein